MSNQQAGRHTPKTGKSHGIRAAAATIVERLAERFRDTRAGLASPPDLVIIDEPTAADIQRARELIEEHGWTHLLHGVKP